MFHRISNARQRMSKLMTGGGGGSADSQEPSRQSPKKSTQPSVASAKSQKSLVNEIHKVESTNDLFELER